MNITRENTDELNAVVKVQIEKEDYQPKVDKILKDYRRTANIPGFRKGHVPIGLVKKQYGKAVLVDEVNKLLQESLNNYLNEEKLEVLGNPLPKEQKDFDWDKEDYNFEFELGLAPKFEVSVDTKKTITHYNIVADEEMIDNQLKTIQKQYGKLVSKEEVEEGDLIAGTFVNEEEEIENTTTLEVNDIKGKRNLGKFLGAKKGDELKLKTKNLFETNEKLAEYLGVEQDKAEDLDIELSFTISEVNKQEPAELNQELFDKLFGEGKVTSEEELRKRIKEDAENQFQQQSDQQLLNDVTETLIEETSFELPKEFLQKWIQVSSEKEMSAEEAKDEYENSEKGLRFQLIESKLIQENDLQVQLEEIKEMTKDRIKMQMAQFGQLNPDEKELDDIAARVLSNQEEVKKLSEQVMNQKLLDFYKEKANLEIKEITYENFVKEVYK
ncbi:trigger factor [Haloflavibacter putidus]|uniref:Trigger factor n=1 Tax=Haloflavibacter putidus TaxID=2576776 RepID=A0A507ZRM4_9FLAO|nr:trigger factor [Haloflavibacter putidus]TQD39657.1 trigger factor [Haloflavibacter putidus]